LGADCSFYSTRMTTAGAALFILHDYGSGGGKSTLGAVCIDIESVP
jgi:hypothetical protein